MYMASKKLLLFVVFLLGVSIIYPKFEGMETPSNATVDLKLTKNALVTKIQINSNKMSGDYWINLGDITVRNKQGQQVNIQNRAQFGNGGGVPNSLSDNDRISMGHSTREVENLVIQLPEPTDVGTIQITNRQDCCWHRIGGYRLSVYNNTELLGEIYLDNPSDPNNAKNTLVGQGKSVTYRLVNAPPTPAPVVFNWKNFTVRPPGIPINSTNPTLK